MRRTLKDSFLKVRALRARELREVSLLSFFLPVFFYIRTFDYQAFFKYNYCRNLKVAIFMGKFIEEFYYGILIHKHEALRKTKLCRNKWKS